VNKEMRGLKGGVLPEKLTVANVFNFDTFSKDVSYNDLVLPSVDVKRTRHTPHCRDSEVLPYTILTQWSTVLLEKLTGFQLVKKLPAFYGARKFITAVTSARQLSLS
jgi:hypothetical protein